MRSLRAATPIGISGATLQHVLYEGSPRNTKQKGGEKKMKLLELFGSDGPLGLFMEKRADKELSKRLVKRVDADEDIQEIIAVYQTVVFETAFALAQLFDVYEPEAAARLEEIVKGLKAKKLLPTPTIFPREKGPGHRGH
jgi:hypothetical protein